MHSEQSTCSPDMVWPPNPAPGAKCVTKAEYAELEAAEASGVLSVPAAAVAKSSAKAAAPTKKSAGSAASPKAKSVKIKDEDTRR